MIPIFLLIFLFCFCVVTIFLVYIKSRRKNDFEQNIINIVLVVFGFSLALIAENIQKLNTEKQERDILVVMIKLELSDMSAVIKKDIDTMERNLTLAQGKKENLEPLMPINTNAWESAKLRNNIFINNTGDLFKLVFLYSVVHYANTKITAREHFRLNNSLDGINYDRSLQKIDIDLKQTLEKLNPYVAQAQKFLDDEYPMIVKGYSFDINTGIIEKGK